MLIDDVARDIDKHTNPDDLLVDNDRFDFAYVDVGITMAGGVIIDGQNMKDYLYKNTPHEMWFYKYVKEHIYNITPPSDYSWVEWSYQGIGKYGVLVKYGEYDPDVAGKKQGHLPSYIEEVNPSHMMHLSFFASENNVAYSLPCGAWVFIRDDGMPIENDGGGYCFIRCRQEYSDFVNERMDSIREFSVITIFTLSMLNVKNVVRVEHKPDRKLQDRRKKRGQLPLVKYYTLEVEVPGKRVIGSTHADPSETGSRPLHLVRGHLADYRDGKGLFGKYKGVYWVPAHMRGDIDNGVIKKRYKVTPKG